MVAYGILAFFMWAYLMLQLEEIIRELRKMNEGEKTWHVLSADEDITKQATATSASGDTEHRESQD